MIGGKITSLNILYIPTGKTRDGVSVVIHNNSAKKNIVIRKDIATGYYGEVETVEGTYIKLKLESKTDPNIKEEWIFNAGSASILVYEKNKYGSYTYSQGVSLGALRPGDMILGIRRGVYGSLSYIFVCRDVPEN